MNTTNQTQTERGATMYLVTKKFISGPLAGMTITERTAVRFNVGTVYGPSERAFNWAVRYEVISCERV